MQTSSKTRNLFLVVGLFAAATLLSATVALGARSASLPDRVTNAPELGAVMWSGPQKAFIQIQFDRGTVTAVDRAARTLSILQRQAGHTWRTQSFTIPKGTDIFVTGRARTFRSLRIGVHVRIEQTALLGAALAVVRIDGASNRDVALPPTTAAGSSITGGTAAGGSTANGNNQNPHFLPARFSNAPELKAVVWSGGSNSFIERQFDRGKVTGISAPSSAGADGSITILQRQAGHVWRTQTFAIPASAKIALEGSAGQAAKLKVGMHVRIEQSGPVGGTITVVEVVSQRANRDVDFPTSAG
jgi:hypothetical protein